MSSDVVKVVFDPSEYNMDQRFDFLKTNLRNSLEYLVRDIKYENDVLKKYFIIDIRTLSSDVIKNIFDNFLELERVILSNYLFDYCELERRKSLSTYPYNLELIILINDEQKDKICQSDLLHNLDYALKTFMTEKEFSDLLNREYTFENLDKKIEVTTSRGTINLNHFNYVVGANGSGKTRLLKSISDELNVPLFSMDNVGLSLESSIQNKDDLKKLVYNLSGSYDLDKYSSSSRYLYSLAQILEFSKEQKNIVLLDDLRWNSLDLRNMTKLINTLADYSYHCNSIVLSGCDRSDLIKRKVYKSNIIKLNK